MTPYREPDEERARELEAEENSREALERLAAAGMRRKHAIADEQRTLQALAKTRKTSARFRKRAHRAPRKLLFVPFWFGSCFAVAIVSSIITLIATRDLAEAIAMIVVAFACANATILLGFPILLVFAIYSRIWSAADARTLLVWHASLPFPMPGFVEALSLDHSLSDLQLTIHFTSDAPSATIMDGLIGNLEHAQSVKLLTTNSAQALVLSSLDDGDDPPNGVLTTLRAIIETVLLPVHAVHAIARVDVGEPDAHAMLDAYLKTDEPA